MFSLQITFTLHYIKNAFHLNMHSFMECFFDFTNHCNLTDDEWNVCAVLHVYNKFKIKPIAKISFIHFFSNNYTFFNIDIFTLAFYRTGLGTYQAW